MINLQHVSKVYPLAEQIQTVLQGINITIAAGELVSIMGASGSGKSTLMNMIGLLDKPTTGQYLLNQQEVSRLSDDERAKIRNKMIGFVFQSFFLLPKLTALKNVGLPLVYQGLSPADIEQRAAAILAKVGMTNWSQHLPSQLSGGQQQRVAIARALIAKPAIILADEPTGALDSKVGQSIMDLFIDLNREEQTTIIIVTHDAHIAQQCQRIIHIADGCVIPQHLASS